MAEKELGTGIHYFADPNKGKPVFFGSVYVGAADLDPFILANRVDVVLLQEGGTRIIIAPAQQPLITGAGGQIVYNNSPAVIIVTDTASVSVYNQAGIRVNYNPRYNDTSTTTAIISSGQKPINGSFEVESAPGIPANWLTSVISGSITVDTTESSHGLKSLNFAGIDSTGAGTATSDKFDVLSSSSIDVRFSYRSTAVNTLNSVSVQYYDINNAPVSTDIIYTEGAANPATYTSYLLRSVVPATAVLADILLDGVNSAGTTTSANTYFDNILIDHITENTVVSTDFIASNVNTVKIKTTCKAGTACALLPTA